MAELFQPKFVDLVRNYTTTIGTDDFVLSAAVNGFSSFTEACEPGDTFYYAAVGVDKPAEREVGRGTLGPNGTISREPTTGTKTNFSSGTKSIALVAASEWFSEVDVARTSAGPINVKSFGAKGDSDASALTGTDDTAAIQAALDHIGSIGGGALYFPEGFYKVSSYLTLPQFIRVCGAHASGTAIVQTAPGGDGGSPDLDVRNGCVFYSNWPSNASTWCDIVIQNIRLSCAAGASSGAGFYDNGGSHLKLRNVAIEGFKYCVVLDQSELVDIHDCYFAPGAFSGACVFIANATLKPGNTAGFSNRISVANSDLQGGATAYGILDDGGYAHSFVDNNYNGCTNHIRAADVFPLLIRGGEFESASGACVWISSIASTGEVFGGCSTVVDGCEFTPSGTNHAIQAVGGGAGLLTIQGATFFAGPLSGIVGAGSFAAIYALSYYSATNTPAMDRPAQYVSVDLCNPGLGPTIEGVTFADGAVKASNIGTAAAHSASDFLQPSNNLGDVADRIAAARNLGTGCMLAQSAVAVSHTGDTNEFTLASVTVPANSMGANGRVEVKARLTVTNSATSKTVTLKFGGTSFATKATSNASLVSMEGDIANRGSPASQSGSAAFLTGTAVNNNSPTAAAIDTTQDQTLAITGQLGSAGDTITLESCQFILYPGN